MKEPTAAATLVDSLVQYETVTKNINALGDPDIPATLAIVTARISQSTNKNKSDRLVK